jgi:hypothetical protein
MFDSNSISWLSLRQFKQACSMLDLTQTESNREYQFQKSSQTRRIHNYKLKMFDSNLTRLDWMAISARKSQTNSDCHDRSTRQIRVVKLCKGGRNRLEDPLPHTVLPPTIYIKHATISTPGLVVHLLLLTDRQRLLR